MFFWWAISRRGVSAWLFELFLVIMAINLATIGLDSVSRYGWQPYKSAHCAAGTFYTKEGQPCTGQKRDLGWPFVVRTQYRGIKSTNGKYLLSSYSECKSGCKPHSFGKNFVALGGVIGGSYLIFTIIKNVYLSKKIRELEYADAHRWTPPTSPTPPTMPSPDGTAGQ